MAPSAKRKRAKKGEEPWYTEGVRFRCVGVECGDCCSGRWGAGYVWMSIDDMERLAQHLELSFDDFCYKYVKQVGLRFSLIEKPNQDCIFYEDERGCRVYNARPNQCRAYPFWDNVIASLQSWNDEEASCPGINQGGPDCHYTRDEIEAKSLLHTRGRLRT